MTRIYFTDRVDNDLDTPLTHVRGPFENVRVEADQIAAYDWQSGEWRQVAWRSATGNYVFKGPRVAGQDKSWTLHAYRRIEMR